MNDIINGWILPLLIYSGPLLTFGLVIIFFPTSRRKIIFFTLLGIHILAFVPFMLNFHEIHALIFPSLTGAATFSTGILYLIIIFIIDFIVPKFKKKPNNTIISNDKLI